MSDPRERKDHDQFDKEGAMAANDRKDGKQDAGAPRPYPSALHEEMGMTHEQVMAALSAQGETRESALATFDKVIASVEETTAPRARKAASRPIALSELPGIEMPCRIAYYDETVAAGMGSHFDGRAIARPASIADFFGRHDWGSVIAVRVSGWSMKDDQIADGDVVVVDTKREPKDGDVVLAHVAGQGQVVKRLRLSEFGSVVLESANPAFAPIVVDDPEGLTIHGVVVARGGEL